MLSVLAGRARASAPALPAAVRQAVDGAALPGRPVLPGAGAAWVRVAAAVGGQDAVFLSWVPLQELLQGGVVRDSLGFVERGLIRGRRHGYNQTRNRSSTTSGCCGWAGAPGVRGRGWAGRRGGRAAGAAGVGSPGRSGLARCSLRPGRAGGVAGAEAGP